APGQLLGLAVRGPLRRAPVRGVVDVDAHGERRARQRARGAGGIEGAAVGPQGPAARADATRARSLGVDGGADRGAGEGPEYQEKEGGAMGGWSHVDRGPTGWWKVAGREPEPGLHWRSGQARRNLGPGKAW